MTRIICRVAALGAAFLLAAAAHAQTWRAKPIRWIVPYPPGGITDTVTRLVTQRVSEAFGQPIVVENRPGANSILGADLAAKAAPDGYTFLTVIAAHAANAPDLRDKLVQMGIEPVGNTPDQLAQFINDEIARWAKVINTAGVKAEQ
ncbi:MAG TPA: tripartite tricarboxylate transporter substrate-binding protein [Burkholderiales bacterium]|nr:tripartite tricarboxylate transporter substrate-binding protein [Burkholderiales bacterium]